MTSGYSEILNKNLDRVESAEMELNKILKHVTREQFAAVGDVLPAALGQTPIDILGDDVRNLLNAALGAINLGDGVKKISESEKKAAIAFRDSRLKNFISVYGVVAENLHAWVPDNQQLTSARQQLDVLRECAESSANIIGSLLLGKKTTHLASLVSTSAYSRL